jgi:ABC-type spermidine/putrescine transport system permease subunit II
VFADGHIREVVVTVSAVQFLRGMTALPLLVPLLAVGLELLLWPLGVEMPSRLEEALGVALAAVLHFGVPYVIVMAGAIWFLRKSSLAAHVWAR